jgi:hypothetical protein
MHCTAIHYAILHCNPVRHLLWSIFRLNARVSCVCVSLYVCVCASKGMLSGVCDPNTHACSRSSSVQWRSGCSRRRCTLASELSRSYSYKSHVCMYIWVRTIIDKHSHIYAYTKPPRHQPWWPLVTASYHGCQEKEIVWPLVVLAKRDVHVCLCVCHVCAHYKICNGERVSTHTLSLYIHISKHFLTLTLPR